jgi:formylmethanofuran dehydrogenase subunit E
MTGAAMDTLKSVHSEDEELVAIVENDACGVDALQCITGCTFGKGNLLFRDYGKQVYTIYSRSTRAGVRVVFHSKNIPEEMRRDRKALTEWILSAPANDILSATQISVPEPEPARIRKSTMMSPDKAGGLFSNALDDVEHIDNIFEVRRLDKDKPDI